MRWGRAFAGIVSGLVVVSAGISGVAAHAATPQSSVGVIITPITPDILGPFAYGHLSFSVQASGLPGGTTLLADVQVTVLSGTLVGGVGCRPVDVRRLSCQISVTGTAPTIVTTGYLARISEGTDTATFDSSLRLNATAPEVAINIGLRPKIAVDVSLPPYRRYYRPGESLSADVNVRNVGTVPLSSVSLRFSSDSDVLLAATVNPIYGCSPQAAAVTCPIDRLIPGATAGPSIAVKLPSGRAFDGFGSIMIAASVTARDPSGTLISAEGNAAIPWDNSGGVVVEVTSTVGRSNIPFGLSTWMDVKVKNTGSRSTDVGNYHPTIEIVSGDGEVTSTDPRCPAVAPPADSSCRVDTPLAPGEETVFHLKYTAPETGPSNQTVCAELTVGNLSTSPNCVYLRFVPRTDEPRAPSALVLESKTGTSIGISWFAPLESDDVASYDVYRDGTLVGNTTETSFRDTGLLPATTYVYTVRAVDKDGAALGVSKEFPASTVDYVETPMDLRVLSVDKTTVRLAWKANTDVDVVVGYDVYEWNTRIDGTRTATTITLRDLDPGRRYKFSVRARGFTGIRSLPATIVVVTTDTTPPTMPTNLHVISVKSTRVRIGWTASTDNVEVTGYDVLVDGERFDGTLSSTTVTLIGLLPNRTYSVQVRAKDDAGNLSPASSAVSVTTTA